MQILLTKEEHDALVNAGAVERQRLAATLQDLCTKVADYMPTEKPWDWKDGDPLRPYGCVRTTRNEYCDTCPVKDVCPMPHKPWSQ